MHASRGGRAAARTARRTAPVPFDVVLSGGGMKGAFQYGFFRRLYELVPDFEIRRMFAVSVGAINAVPILTRRMDVLADHWERGDGAMPYDTAVTDWDSVRGEGALRNAQRAHDETPTTTMPPPAAAPLLLPPELAAGASIVVSRAAAASTSAPSAPPRLARGELLVRCSLYAKRAASEAEAAGAPGAVIAEAAADAVVAAASSTVELWDFLLRYFDTHAPDLLTAANLAAHASTSGPALRERHSQAARAAAAQAALPSAAAASGGGRRADNSSNNGSSSSILSGA